MADKRFLLFGWTEDETSGGFSDLITSTDTEHQAAAIALNSEYSNYDIFDRMHGTSIYEQKAFKMFMVVAVYFEDVKPGLKAGIASSDNLEEAVEIARKEGGDNVEIYDRIGGGFIDLHQYSWYPAQ